MTSPPEPPDLPKKISETKLRCLKCGQKGVAHFEHRKRTPAQAEAPVPIFASDGFYLRVKKKRESDLQIVCHRCGMAQREARP
jgi:RNase P subunit RPR2